MPIIRVEMAAGRTQEHKRALVDALPTSLVETCGGKREGVYVVIQDLSSFGRGVGGELSRERLAAAAKRVGS